MSEQIDLTTPSSIEYVDFALYDWLDKELNLFYKVMKNNKKENNLNELNLFDILL